jgi:hypothetical protein
VGAAERFGSGEELGVKDDEARLLLLIANRPAGRDVRQVIASSGINHKRCWYILEKWGKRGWYNWGVTLDLGWLEQPGREAAELLESTRNVAS